MRIFRGIKPDAEINHKCISKPIDTKHCKHCKFKDECEFYDDKEEES
jgi:hypothetical protein